MSLTSEIKNKNSNLSHFFIEYKNKNGGKDLIKYLKNNKPNVDVSYKISDNYTHGLIGTTIDYIIRYIAKDNILDIQETIAYKTFLKYFPVGKNFYEDPEIDAESEFEAPRFTILFATELKRGDDVGAYKCILKNSNIEKQVIYNLIEIEKAKKNGVEIEISHGYVIHNIDWNFILKNVKKINQEHFKKQVLLILNKIAYMKLERGKFNLSDQETDILFDKLIDKTKLSNKTIHVFNLFKLGKSIIERHMDALNPDVVKGFLSFAILDNLFRSNKLPAGFYNNNDTMELFNEFYNVIGGDLYTNELFNLIKIFKKEINDIDGSLYGSEFVVLNSALSNSGLVGGADFDCIIKYNGKFILTDIKAIKSPINGSYLKQLLGYAFLYDKEKDKFDLTDIGFYYARSGAFRYISCDDAVKIYLTGFNNTDEARTVFVKKLSNSVKTH